MPTGRTRRRRARAGGFTYVGLLVLLAILGLVGAAGLKMGTVLQRAAAEDELLDIGAAFSDALASYAAASPQGTLTQPPTLQELLKDPRFPNIRRHLRKLFVDPITGNSEWGIVRLGGKDSGGIIGVYSLSQTQPLKLGNFDARFQGFDNKTHLSDWRFMAAGQAAALPPALVPAAGQTAGAAGQAGQSGAAGQAPDPAPTPLAPGAATGAVGTSAPPPPEAAPAPPEAAPDAAPAPAPVAAPELGAAPPEADPKEPVEAAEPAQAADPNEPARPAATRR